MKLRTSALGPVVVLFAVIASVDPVSAGCLTKISDCSPPPVNWPKPPPPPPTPDQIRKSAEKANREATEAAAKANREATEAIRKKNQEITDALAHGNTGVTNAGRKTSVELAQGGRRFMQVGQEWGDAFADAMCELAGKPRKGKDKHRGDCSINGGVGYDTGGGYYTYDPQHPEDKYYIDSSDLRTLNEAELAALSKDPNFKPREMQAWEKLDEDRFFAGPNQPLGMPWKGVPGETLHLPTKTGKQRPGGDFLSIRTDKGHPGQYRFHMGIDYTNKVGDEVYAVMSGEAKLAKPHYDGHYGLTITAANGYVAQQFYFLPPPAMMEKLAHGESVHVERGEMIGHAQDLHFANGQPAYPANTPQHTHVSMRDPKGNFVAPDGSTHQKIWHAKP